MEIITGLEPLDKTRDYVDIINHVEDYVDGQPDRILKLVDPRLGSSFTEGSVLQMYAVANDCLITRKLKRPFLKDVCIINKCFKRNLRTAKICNKNIHYPHK